MSDVQERVALLEHRIVVLRWTLIGTQFSVIILALGAVLS